MNKRSCYVQGLAPSVTRSMRRDARFTSLWSFWASSDQCMSRDFTTATVAIWAHRQTDIHTAQPNHNPSACHAISPRPQLLAPTNTLMHAAQPNHNPSASSSQSYIIMYLLHANYNKQNCPAAYYSVRIKHKKHMGLASWRMQEWLQGEHWYKH